MIQTNLSIVEAYWNRTNVSPVKDCTTDNLSVNAAVAAKCTLRGLFPMLRLHTSPFLFIRREEEMERPVCKLLVYSYSHDQNQIKRMEYIPSFQTGPSRTVRRPLGCYLPAKLLSDISRLKTRTSSLVWTPSVIPAKPLARACALYHRVI